VDLRGKCYLGCQIQHLILDVRAIIGRHPHSLVEILQGAVGHLQRLSTDCRHTSQVGLVTLVLENCFFSDFNSVLLLQLLNHRLNKFILKLRCLDLLLDLILNLLHLTTPDESFANDKCVFF